MSLASNLTTAFTAVGTAIKATRSMVGTLANLTTTAKGDTVSAINEVRALAISAGSGLAIDDTTPSTSKVYSSTKTNSQISTAIAAVVGATPAALDTLVEIANQLATDESATAGILTSLGLRVRVDAAQSFDATQKAQGNANLGSLSLVNSGDPATDFAAVFATAIA